jgi:hypothetical protein
MIQCRLIPVKDSSRLIDNRQRIDQDLGPGTGLDRFFTDIPPPLSGTGASAIHSKHVPSDMVQANTAPKLALRVPRHLPDNLCPRGGAPYRLSGQGHNFGLQLGQKIGIRIGFTPDHYAIDVGQVVTHLIDRPDTTIQNDP